MDSNMYQTTPECTKKLSEFDYKLLPFDKLEPGLSFFVPFKYVKEKSFRALVSNFSARLDKHFNCVKHIDKEVYEVTIIPKSETTGLVFNIVESSPKAMEVSRIKLEGKRIYPFEELIEGKSFTIPISEANEDSLRTTCCVKSKLLGKKFICVKHNQYDIYEVACISKLPVALYDISPAAQERSKQSEQ